MEESVSSVSALGGTLSRVDCQLVCEVCNKLFTSIDDLESHKHTSERSFQCDVCGKTFQYFCQLQRHMKSKNIHKSGHQLEKESLTFRRMEDFTEWKERMEVQSKSKYVHQHGSRKNRNGTSVTYLYCHRNGFFHSKGNNIRSIKSLGSNKINGHCPSKIVLRQQKNIINVEFIKTHQGHTLDIGRLSLTKKEKDDIANKISMKIPLEVILDGIRDSVHDSEVHRLHLTKKKDLYNIIEQYGLNKDAVYRCQDFTNVDSWVKYMQETSNVIRFYKPQGEILESHSQLQLLDFCLIVANDIQVSVLEKYGNGVVCLDETDGLNPHTFELYTLLVTDELRDGFPCAFMVSNRSDSVMMELFFNKIKSCLNSDIKPKYFMTSVVKGFFNNWLAVFPFHETRPLFNSWHVDKAWRQNIHKNIVGKKRQAEVYKQLKMLMSEMDPVMFDAMAKHILDELNSNPKTQAFASYIATFVSQPQPWALCYRFDVGMDINVHLENLHQNLEYIYLKGKAGKRFDKGMHALMKFTRDKMFDSLIMFHRGKVMKKLSTIRVRHKRSLEMSGVEVQQTSERNWIVISENGEEQCRVTIINENCSCNLKCSDCLVCIHYYSCTCMDAAIKWNMCKHAHFVHRLITLNTNKFPLQIEPAEFSEINVQQDQSSTTESVEETFPRENLQDPGTINTNVNKYKVLKEIKDITIMLDLDLTGNEGSSMNHFASVKHIIKDTEPKHESIEDFNISESQIKRIKLMMTPINEGHSEESDDVINLVVEKESELSQEVMENVEECKPSKIVHEQYQLSKGMMEEEQTIVLNYHQPKSTLKIRYQIEKAFDRVI